MPFRGGGQTRVGPKNCVLDGGSKHIGATWSISLNEPCTVVMRSNVTLFWVLVYRICTSCLFAYTHVRTEPRRRSHLHWQIPASIRNVNCALGGRVENESVPIQLAQRFFAGLAISSSKIWVYFSNKIYGSNCIKQHTETAVVWN